MHPVVELFGWSVGGYSLMLVVGLATCVLVATMLAPKFDLSRRFVLICGLGCVFTGYWGAKLYSAVVEVNVVAWSRGEVRAGLSIHGGLGAGIAFAIATSYIARVRSANALDLAAVVLPLGLVFGRLGCLLSGCCYGKPTRFVWALIYRDFGATARPIGVPLHATPVYLAVGNLVIFLVVLAWRMDARRVAGQLALEVLAAVGFLRFLVEFLRADNRGPALLFGWPWAQWVALCLAVGAVGWLLTLGRKFRLR